MTTTYIPGVNATSAQGFMAPDFDTRSGTVTTTFTAGDRTVRRCPDGSLSGVLGNKIIRPGTYDVYIVWKAETAVSGDVRWNINVRAHDIAGGSDANYSPLVSNVSLTSVAVSDGDTQVAALAQSGVVIPSGVITSCKLLRQGTEAVDTLATGADIVCVAMIPSS